MNVNKKMLALLTATLLGISTTALGTQPVKAADHVITKTLMHNSVAYTLSGKRTKNKYRAFSSVRAIDRPVIINKQPYYWLDTKKQRLIKAANIDGVKRKVKHNSYVYATGSRKAGLGLVKKGKTIITYGSNLRFKNGKRCFRIGGPSKQYIKASNVGPIIGSPTEETTVTVTRKRGSVIYEHSGQETKKHIKARARFKVDRLETGEPAETIMDERAQFGPDPEIYRIKGTNQWLWSKDVKAKKKLPLHNYDKENFSYIKFYQDTDVYNADGTMQDHNGHKIVKQAGHLKVDQLLYIWVPSEQKADLFYHLVGHKFYATGNIDKIDVGNGYVKAKAVKFVDGVKLKPINTLEEAEDQARAAANK
ncbi:SLAP domain-containing protein [Lactobacillus xylocopicola]|uniref:S-layer protein C-terminal domain-containing protein n=1 Tax=Lactobacillus xylocopicola TaxID=2976676 RepID=A0ABM8BIE8_9LACO|nr:SLAP domain-containing protein [Lactobacillus xylocopicola]BDR61077.1 hypothetical protein KIM322_13380 [Lactobacillus xylocopicola]